MPLVILLPLLLIALVMPIVLVPLALVQRYRAGKSRRVARPWLATLNAGTLVISVLCFLAGVAFTSLWVTKAFPFALAGLAGGCLLGILGLALTRWERTPDGLHYTPNSFLALAVTLLVAARLAYSLWRVWQGWSLAAGERAWLIDSGIPGSLAVGGIALGYSLAYWIGVSRWARQ
jgi:hypothetical protein